MSWFVKPQSDVLKLSEGQTITVKRRLNTGEQRDAREQMAVQTDTGGLRLNLLTFDIATVHAYLLDWSLTDDDGKLVVIRDQAPAVVMAALRALDPNRFDEIKDAVEAHDAKIQKELDAAKNAQAGGNGSSAISPLPVVVTGDTATS